MVESQGKYFNGNYIHHSSFSYFLHIALADFYTFPAEVNVLCQYVPQKKLFTQ